MNKIWHSWWSRLYLVTYRATYQLCTNFLVCTYLVVFDETQCTVGSVGRSANRETTSISSELQLRPIFVSYGPFVDDRWSKVKFPQDHVLFLINFLNCIKIQYSKALRCTFFGERKNSCSSKFVQLLLLNRVKARWSENRAAQGFHFINLFISNFFGPNSKMCTFEVRAAQGRVSQGLTVYNWIYKMQILHQCYGIFSTTLFLWKISKELYKMQILHQSYDLLATTLSLATCYKVH